MPEPTPSSMDAPVSGGGLTLANPRWNAFADYLFELGGSQLNDELKTKLFESYQNEFGSNVASQRRIDSAEGRAAVICSGTMEEIPLGLDPDQTGESFLAFRPRLTLVRNSNTPASDEDTIRLFSKWLGKDMVAWSQKRNGNTSREDFAQHENDPTATLRAEILSQLASDGNYEVAGKKFIDMLVQSVRTRLEEACSIDFDFDVYGIDSAKFDAIAAGEGVLDVTDLTSTESV